MRYLSFLLLIFLLPASGYAADVTVYTVGDPSITVSYLEAIKKFFSLNDSNGNAGYKIFAFFIGLFGIIFFAIKFQKGGGYHFSNYLMMLLLASGFIYYGVSSKMDLEVKNVTSDSNTAGVTVNDVPFLAVFPAYVYSFFNLNFVNMVGYSLEKVDDEYKNFSIRNGYAYALPNNILLKSQLVSPYGDYSYVNKNIYNYLKDCYLPEVANNSKHMEVLLTTDNILDEISVNSDTNTTYYTSNDSDAVEDKCSQAYSNGISKYFTNGTVNKQVNNYSYPTSPDYTETVQDMFFDDVIANSTQNKQSVLSNSIVGALYGIANENDLSPKFLTSYLNKLDEYTKFSSSSGYAHSLFNKTMGLFMAVLIFMFPFVIPFILAGKGYHVVIAYFKMMLFLIVLTPVLELVNFFNYYVAKNSITDVYTISSLPGFWSERVGFAYFQWGGLVFSFIATYFLVRFVTGVVESSIINWNENVHPVGSRNSLEKEDNIEAEDKINRQKKENDIIVASSSSIAASSVGGANHGMITYSANEYSMHGNSYSGGGSLPITYSESGEVIETASMATIGLSSSSAVGGSSAAISAMQRDILEHSNDINMPESLAPMIGPRGEAEVGFVTSSGMGNYDAHQSGGVSLVSLSEEYMTDNFGTDTFDHFVGHDDFADSVSNDSGNNSVLGLSTGGFSEFSLGNASEEALPAGGIRGGSADKFESSLQTSGDSSYNFNNVLEHSSLGDTGVLSSTRHATHHADVKNNNSIFNKSSSNLLSDAPSGATLGDTSLGDGVSVRGSGANEVFSVDLLSESSESTSSLGETSSGGVSLEGGASSLGEASSGASQGSAGSLGGSSSKSGASQGSAGSLGGSSSKSGASQGSAGSPSGDSSILNGSGDDNSLDDLTGEGNPVKLSNSKKAEGGGGFHSALENHGKD